MIEMASHFSIKNFFLMEEHKSKYKINKKFIYFF